MASRNVVAAFFTRFVGAEWLRHAWKFVERFARQTLADFAGLADFNASVFERNLAGGMSPIDTNHILSCVQRPNRLTSIEGIVSFDCWAQSDLHSALSIMIHREEYSPQAVYVGADEELGTQLRATVESKSDWSFTQIRDTDTSHAIQSERPATISILYISDEVTYAQSLGFLNQTDRTSHPAIVIYDQLSSQQLLELFRAGAVECLGRPLNLSRLSLVLDMLFVPSRTKTVPEVVPKSESWHTKLMEQVHAVASLSTTVLITGETGSGKTRLSRMIHGLSNRKSKPFLALNCGALTESLLDTELFGHVRGAFTGADNDYAGKLSQCQDGTLLLDEIDMLSPTAQVKLLQVVEDRIFQPVGSTEFEPLQARLIVASNRPLQQQVAEGEFRSDLFYRLNVMSFRLPPLRERRSEIQPLVSGFVSELANQHGFETAVVMPHAFAALESYGWPGNIRELKNVVERAVILSAGQPIEPGHLPSHIVESVGQSRSAVANDRPNLPRKNKLAHARSTAEREQLLIALERNGNNRSKTAIDLGISRVALYKRLRKLQIV